MDSADFYARGELLNLSELRERRPDWTDRLPLVPLQRLRTVPVRRRWWSWVPMSTRELYMLWLARRRYRLNVEQIHEDQIDDLASASMRDDSREALHAVQEKHGRRLEAARFLVAAKERYRLERLARRWDIDTPKMIEDGEANEPAIAHVRRAIREARWTFIDRCAKLLVPVLSLLVALSALFLNFTR